MGAQLSTAGMWDGVTELEKEDVLGLGQSLRYHCELLALVDVSM